MKKNLEPNSDSESVFLGGDKSELSRGALKEVMSKQETYSYHYCGWYIGGDSYMSKHKAKVHGVIDLKEKLSQSNYNDFLSKVKINHNIDVKCVTIESLTLIS